ncbi:MAG: hypothetical protein AB1898_00320 [Acidobacteriota bacterium]
MKRLAWGLVLAVLGFLGGFLSQYSTVGQLREELSRTNQNLASCQFKGGLAELRDLAAMMYLEASQKNYNLAGGHSTRFFNRVREVLAQVDDASLKQGFQELLDLRDATTSGLATGDPGVLAGVQNILIKIHQITKS